MKTHSTFDPFDRASLHPITCDRPAPDFFAGALLGNGGLGAVVTTRPDAVAIHFGHNNVWDVRIAEANADRIGKFEDLFARVKAIWAEKRFPRDDPWLRDYCQMTSQNYAKPYPRPFPCGTVLLGFDRRDVELLGHRLDVATGVCDVRFVVGGTTPRVLRVFVDTNADRLWLRVIDADGAPSTLPFNRIRLLTDSETPKEFPARTEHVDESSGVVSFRQTLPFAEDCARHARDRAMRLGVRVSARVSAGEWLNWNGVMQAFETLERRLDVSEPFVACVQLDEGSSSTIANGVPEIPTPDEHTFEKAESASRESWRDYWSRSGVALDSDEFLERIWYHNLYFLNCSLKAGATCPGLFANWNYGKIGSEWHGDYHMNYNTQQPFWVTFSSNHVDKHLAYADLVDHLLPISRKWATEYYGLRGAYFPHSAYPVEMNIMPYPVPTWGWEICETPWTVQSLWWHFLYTQDKHFLADRAFGPIQEAVRFLVDYMKRPDARGANFGDDRYHVFPTVVPELFGIADDPAYNRDCLVDLTLIRFVFNAYVRACDVLERSKDDRELLAEVREVLAHYPRYSTAHSERAGGDVFVSAPPQNPETVYNAPNSIMTVFPGEEHGLHSPPEEYELAVRTYRQHRNEGGNDLVFYPLAGARLGVLDLEQFKRQVRYCLLPNGTCTDLVMQVQGRYNDRTPYDFMGRMGIWFENFALPAVINECLMQSVNGEIRLFPNWPKDQRAEFRTLRAVGAFLVSALFEDGAVRWVEIMSEAGAPLRLINPWTGPVRCGQNILTGERIELPTTSGETLTFEPA